MKIWSRDESKERFPRPISPLGWSLLFVPMNATLTQMSKTLGGKRYTPEELMLWHKYYVYTRKDFFKSIRNIKPTLARTLKLVSCVLKNVVQEGLGSFFNRGPFLSRLGQGVLLDMFGRDIEHLVRTWPEELKMILEKMSRDYRLDGKTGISFEEFVSVRKQMQEDSVFFFSEDFNVYFFKHLLSSMLKSQLCRAGLPEIAVDDLLQALSNGLEKNFSIRMIADFSNSSISTEELKKRYGHLTDNWDLLSPVMGEQESLWLQRSVPSVGTVEKKERNEQAFLEMKKALSWNKQLSQIISWYQNLILMDEELRAYSSLQYPQARQLMGLVEKNSEWKSQGLVKDSIYFLSFQEIEMGLQKKNFSEFVSLIAERKKGFTEALATNPPAEFTESPDGKISYVQALVASRVSLKGECVSAGSVTGKVTFVRDYNDLARISRNSVLVIESATPVFSPFYAVCGGIIAEVGGHLSHGAIVARECGIPMLTGVENACGVLVEGQEIHLDADQGIIEVLNG